MKLVARIAIAALFAGNACGTVAKKSTEADAGSGTGGRTTTVALDGSVNATDGNTNPGGQGGNVGSAGNVGSTGTGGSTGSGGAGGSGLGGSGAGGGTGGAPVSGTGGKAASSGGAGGSGGVSSSTGGAGGTAPTKIVLRGGLRSVAGTPASPTTSVRLLNARFGFATPAQSCGTAVCLTSGGIAP